jgi:ABC-2 type transport system ATP-binding protein
MEVRRQMGILPQQLDLARRETIAAYLRRFAAYYDVHLTSKQLTTYCASYELEPSLQVASLSCRQARIFALSLSLVHDPRLVLLDEPLSGLSAVDQSAIWPYLQRIQREGRTLLCTFSSPLAEKYLSGYDLIVRLEQGRLMRQEI